MNDKEVLGASSPEESFFVHPGPHFQCMINDIPPAASQASPGKTLFH